MSTICVIGSSNIVNVVCFCEITRSTRSVHLIRDRYNLREFAMFGSYHDSVALCRKSSVKPPLK